jgi:hypothetical protein
VSGAVNGGSQYSYTVSQFRAIIASTSNAEAEAIVVQTPSLLWSRTWPICEKVANTLDEPSRRRGHLALNTLRSAAARLEAKPELWVARTGPIQRIAAKVIQGEDGLQHALIAARQPAVADSLCPGYVQCLADYQMHQAFRGNASAAVTVMRLLLGSIDEISIAADKASMSALVVPYWIQIVTLAVNLIPDLTIFEDAVRRGQALVLEQESAGDQESAAANLNRLGTLHLDSYCLGRTPQTLAVDVRLWLQRAQDSAGHDADMPSFLSAMESAVGYFERALQSRHGEGKGLTIKAYLQALMMRQVAGGPAPGLGLLELANQGLSLLSRATHPNEVAYLDAVVAELGGGEDKEEISGLRYLLEANPADEVAKFGLSIAIGRYLTAGQTLAALDPEAAINVLRLSWPLVSEPNQESRKVQCVNLVRMALVQIYTVPLSSKPTPDEFSRSEQSFLEQAQANKWSRPKLASALMSAASMSSLFDLEEVGIKLADRSISLCLGIDDTLAQMFMVARASLWLGAGVNAYQLRDWGKALGAYGSAAIQYTHAKLFESSIDCLQRIADITFAEPAKPAAHLVAALANCATPISMEGHSNVDERLHELWDRAIHKIAEDRPTAIPILTVGMLAAKGAAFAATASADSPYDWRSDDVAISILARIHQLEGASALEEDTRNSATEDLSIMGFSDDLNIERPNETPLQSLQRRFDLHVRRKQTDGRFGLRKFQQLSPRIDRPGEQTVFLTQFLCRSASNKPALITFASTNESTFLAVGTYIGLGITKVIVDGTSMSDVGLVVAGVREAVLDDPGPGRVTSLGAEHLERDMNILFGGGIASRLQTWRESGKTHLCIHAHGPYHYYPQHLIGPRDHPLADDWVVTYVPHPVAMGLTSNRPHSKIELVAFGLDFSSRENDGFARLEKAVSEAELVAAAFKGEIYCNEAATKSRFLGALETSRRIHVSTHGSQLPLAPTFQRLFFHPEHSSDGVVYAYELLGLNLRHIDLITLSACETSLGRFDVADNPRGLVAALFAGGVQTVVATMWPVLADAALAFFSLFYQSLHAGADKLTAFRNAQIETRKQYPAYRDWGAFQFLGAW